MSTLGQNIVKARVDKRYKQKDLCEMTGLSQKYLSAVELGKAEPRIRVVQKIARALGVSVDAIVGDLEEEPVGVP